MNALSSLLSILRPSINNLPKDPRTLLGTKTTYEISELCGGQYFHFGLKSGIKSILSAEPDILIVDEQIRVQLNMDGLPLFRSSNAQFWPILGRIENVGKGEPFIIGLFYGNSKPSNAADYLSALIEEFNGLKSDGLNYMEQMFTVVLTSVICDSPARAFIKNVKQYSGYHGCDKCIQNGVWAGKMTFPEVDAQLRSDSDFELMLDEDHHKGPSPLVGIVGMICQLENIILKDENVYLVYKRFTSMQKFFDTQLDSDLLGIYMVCDISEDIFVSKLKDIQSKYIVIPFRDDNIAMPFTDGVRNDSDSFYVVEFQELGEVAIVPINWLRGKHFCVWPPWKSAARLEKGVKNMEEADDSFEMFKLKRIVYQTGNQYDMIRFHPRQIDIKKKREKTTTEQTPPPKTSRRSLPSLPPLPQTPSILELQPNRVNDQTPLTQPSTSGHKQPRRCLQEMQSDHSTPRSVSEDIGESDNIPATTSFTDDVTEFWVEGYRFLWNHYYTEGPRTTNHLEGWHIKIKKRLQHVNPNMYEIID
ncbi:unnamed protein product [Mytilus coruscus]|uniref:Transposase domain-containing protein n=1 Tax=Mytilus coruscus TaxID=42192 RepID=A0A6J8BLC3_MYTCO|nr:unnamed protein product [Mytilus coruscus]